MLLEVSHLHKTFPGGVRANDDVSLSIGEGEVFGLLGPNGAGKTTLVGQVLGAVVPTAGSITIDGVDVVAQQAFARRSCSYQPQAGVPIEGLTPLQAIELAGRIRGGRRAEVRERGRRLVGDLHLDEWADKTIPLSGGVARLVAFCMAAVVPGRVVILDEPTNDVDPLRRKLLWQQVRALAEAGSAVLLVTHNVLEAERCVDRLCIIDHGRVLASGTPAVLKRGLGGGLRVEVVLEPGADVPEPPPFVRGATVSGRRLIGEIDLACVQDAIRWATAGRESGVVEEFGIGPSTLEDVYVRAVTQVSAA